MTSSDIDRIDVEYLCHGAKPLLATIYKPRGKGPFPAVVDAHGGAWVMSSRAAGQPTNEHLAANGVVVMAIDFRMPPEAGYPASVQDLNYAVRWLKLHAEEYATRSEWIGMMGTSSGGHLAVLNGIKPFDPRYAAIPNPPGAGTADAKVRFVIPIAPVINPIGRYQFAKEAKAAGRFLAPPTYIGTNPDEFTNFLLSAQERYWGNEAAMAEGAPGLALERGEAVELPEILYVTHPDDPVHPRADIEHFVAQYKKRGGKLTFEILATTAGDYYLLDAGPGSPEARRARDHIAEFCRRFAY